MGGRGGSSGISSGYSKVMNPKTKDDYVKRLKVIAANGQPGYTVSVNTSNWDNYGKSRTYLKLYMSRESNGKAHHSQDYGYFDNNSQKYVPSKSHDLSSSNFYSASGSVMTKSEITNALKKIK